MRTAIVIFLLTISLSAFSQTQQHEYLTMIQIENTIYFSKDSITFEEIKIKDEKIGDYDFRPLLKRIQRYEKEGWEVVANNYSPILNTKWSHNYVLMRRKK